MSRRWWTVLRKELRDASRDRRSLRTLAVMVLLFPLMTWVTLKHDIARKERGDEPIRVGVVGAPQPPQLLARFAQARIGIDAVDAPDAAALRERVADPRHAAVLQLADDFAQRHAAQQTARIVLWHDGARSKAASLERIEAVLRDYGRETTTARLAGQGVPLAHLAPLVVERRDTATPAARSARRFAMMFGLFLLGVFYFGMDIVIDGSAGERERRSLEILLAQPVRGGELIAGKWLAAALVCATALAAEFAIGYGMLRGLPLEAIGLSWPIGLGGLVLMWLVALPLCLLAPALQMAIALNAHSFKEAQSSMLLLLGVTLVPALVPMLDLEPRGWWYGVPYLAEQTLILDLLRDGAIDVRHACTAMGASLAVTAACIVFASRRVGTERYVIGL